MISSYFFRFPSLYRVIQDFDYGRDSYLTLYKGNFIIVKSIAEKYSKDGQIFFYGENSSKPVTENLILK